MYSSSYHYHSLDATKARVLYDSKVLKCRTNKANKTPEYLVHFYGWNSSWDRVVSEKHILKDDLENRQLQRQLAEEAAQGIKWKKVKLNKIPSIIKEVVLSQEETESRESPDYYSSDNSISSEPGVVITTDPDNRMNEPFVWVPFPEEFKRILQTDRENISKGDFYDLPVKVTVTKILNDFHEAVESKQVQDLLPNYNRRHGVTRAFTQTNSRSFSSMLQLVDEFTNSIVIYFNSICNTHLFYSEEEKRAFSSLGVTPSDALGFIHLLRFLLVLPDFIKATTTMTKKNVTHLTSILENFYFFLKKKHLNDNSIQS